MLEIFILTNIKDYSKINNISDNFFDVLNNNDKEIFKKLKLEKFESKFFEGIKISSDIFLKELIILCNGEFGEDYFINYDPIEYNFHSLGTQIIGESKIGEKISKIMLNIAEVTGMLNSNKLLTYSKKDDIKKKIDSSFFTLSGIIFLLYSLKQKTENNLEDLKNVKGKSEYEGQAMLLSETSITKKIELQAAIDKLEGKIELFLSTIKSLIK